MPSNCSSTTVGAYGGPCPDSNAATCEGNYIIYCEEGCLTSAGNCHDALANYPPYGIHDAALCWEEHPGAMNGQCTDDCVPVTMTNGTVFYPEGCSFDRPISNSSHVPVSTSISLALYPTSASASAAVSSVAAGSSNSNSTAPQDSASVKLYPWRHQSRWEALMAAMGAALFLIDAL